MERSSVAMSEEKLNIRFKKSPFIRDEYFEEERKHAEHKLAIELWERLKTEEFYTIKITRTSPYQFYLREPLDIPEGVPDFYETSVYIGKVKPLQMKLNTPKKLSFMERLRVLFTGKIPYRIEIE